MFCENGDLGGAQKLYAGRYWVDYEYDNYGEADGFSIKEYYEEDVQLEINGAGCDGDLGWFYHFKEIKEKFSYKIEMNGRIPEEDILYKL